MKATFRIDYPTSKDKQKYWTKNYGLNAYYAGKPFYKRNEDSKFWHTLTYYAVKGMAPFCEPVRLVFYWNDGLDLSNHAAMAKMIEDGLVRAKKLPNDNRTWVKEIVHRFHYKPYIEVTIETY